MREIDSRAKKREMIVLLKCERERERERLNKKIILSFSNTLQYLLLVAVYRSKLTNFFR